MNFLDNREKVSKKTMNDSTLPGCIGYYGKPIKPNDCDQCQYAKVCKSVVAKDRLRTILIEIEETEEILRGIKLE